MRFKVHSRLVYEVKTPASFVVAIQAADGAGQTVHEEMVQLPLGLKAEFFVDAFAGNRFIRFLAQPGRLELSYDAVVEPFGVVDHQSFVGGAVANDLPVEVLPYLAPSRYCQSDRLATFAREAFGNAPQGLGQVQAIAAWVKDHVSYECGSSSGTTSAVDTLIDRRGVCRDFAHLGIAFCRALDIPARFVSTYAWRLQPPDFHAVFQVFLAGGWKTFDPTGLAPLSGLLPIAFGRDAADVPFVSYFGDAEFQEKTVEVSRLESAGTERAA